MSLRPLYIKNTLNNFIERESIFELSLQRHFRFYWNLTQIRESHIQEEPVNNP